MALVTFTPEEIATFPKGPQGPPGPSGSGGSAVGYPQSWLQMHVDYANGLDANDGLSPSSAKKTIQAAYNTLYAYAWANLTPYAGRLGVGRIDLAPGNHDVGAGAAFERVSPVEIIGRLSGNGAVHAGSSASRIVSSNSACTRLFSISDAGAATLTAHGFCFRDIAFMPDTAALPNLTSCVYGNNVMHGIFDHLLFDLANHGTSNTLAAFRLQETGAGGGDCSWNEFTSIRSSGMQAIVFAAGPNYNNQTLRDWKVFYSGSLPAIHLQGDVLASTFDNLRLEGNALMLLASAPTATQNVFINLNGEADDSANVFMDFTSTQSGNTIVGGYVKTLNNSNGVYVRWGAGTSENRVVGGAKSLGGWNGEKSQVVNLGASSNTIV